MWEVLDQDRPEVDLPLLRQMVNTSGQPQDRCGQSEVQLPHHAASGTIFLKGDLLVLPYFFGETG